MDDEGKCREWMIASALNCVDRFLQETTFPKQVLSWMISLITFKLTSEDSIEGYNEGRKNLTKSECSELIRDVLNTLMSKNLTQEDYQQRLIQSLDVGAHYSILISDLFFYLNITIILVFVSAKMLFGSVMNTTSELTQSKSQLIDKSTQIEDRSIDVDLNLVEIPSILLIAEKDEKAIDETLKVLEKSWLMMEADEKLKKKEEQDAEQSVKQSQPKSLSEVCEHREVFFFAGNSIETTIDTPPSFIESPEITSTPEFIPGEKIRKNFLIINKTNLKLISQRSQSSLNGVTAKPKSRQRQSLIPVADSNVSSKLIKK